MKNQRAVLIDLYGQMMIALETLESCREFSQFIPEVRTNMVYALPDAQTRNDVLAIEGRITVLAGMPYAAGRLRFGASSHMARLILEIRKYDPSIRAGIDFANTPHLSLWLDQYCKENGWIFSAINRANEPIDLRGEEGASMPWKVREVVRAAGGKVPKIAYETGAVGKEPVSVILGNNPIDISLELCEIARKYSAFFCNAHQ
jgi:hydroxymethylpyrimidine/phosphomethylpyrimidine kinase